jgi:hypothetical protein
MSLHETLRPSLTWTLALVLTLGFGAVACVRESAAPPGATPTIGAELTDRVAISSLIDRASDAINHHEWSRLETMLTEDIVWEALPPISFKLEGLEAIRGFFRNNEAKVEVLVYSVAATSIELDGPERATARSTMNELLHLKEKGAGLQIVGTYVDHFVKQNGDWRFSRRQFELRFEDDVELPERRGTKASNVPGSSGRTGETKLHGTPGR